MKKIKYVVMLAVALVMGIQVMNAQNDKEKPKGKRLTAEQMTEIQANRFVRQLGLDDATSAKFTEAYKKYMKELDEVRKRGKMHGKREKPEIDKVPTDAEVEKMMKERFAQGRKMLDIREKYYDVFRKFLSPKQVQMIFDQGEMNRDKFRKELNRRKGMEHPATHHRPSMPERRE